MPLLRAEAHPVVDGRQGEHVGRQRLAVEGEGVERGRAHHARIRRPIVVGEELLEGRRRAQLRQAQQRAQVDVELRAAAEQRSVVLGVRVLVEARDEEELAGQLRQDLLGEALLAQLAVQPHKVRVPARHGDAPLAQALRDVARRAALRGRGEPDLNREG